MNPLVPLTVEILIFAAIYLLASAITWPLRRQCRDEDLLALGMGRCLRHVFARLSRSLAVMAFTGATIGLATNLNWGGAAALPKEPVEAWLRFWEFVFLIAVAEGLAVLFCRILKKPLPIPDLLLNILRGVLVIAALLAVLSFQLDVNISPILGASALVTAVVGFALQGVLGNLLAGMSLHVVRSVVPGDWVAIDDIEGEVTQTNWRETRLRTVGGRLIIVPNSVVASATIHNMSQPTPLRRHQIFIGASYSDAPADVIDALVQSALVAPEVLREPAPSAYLVEYKDFGVNYALRFWTNQYHDRASVEGDVLRVIWYQFKRRGIEIPFPMSDKLLNELVEVIDHQRRRPPEEPDLQQTAADLQRSDFVSLLLLDEKGAALLQEAELVELARSVRRLRFTKGETVFQQGEPGDICYVVAQGKARGRVEYKGVSQANEFDLGPGSLFGEMSLMTGLPRTATVFANEDVELLEISKETFTALLGLREDIPQALAKLIAERAERNKAALDQLKSLEASTVDESIKSASILRRFLRMLGRRE